MQQGERGKQMKKCLIKKILPVGVAVGAVVALFLLACMGGCTFAKKEEANALNDVWNQSVFADMNKDELAQVKLQLCDEVVRRWQSNADEAEGAMKEIALFELAQSKARCNHMRGET